MLGRGGVCSLVIPEMCQKKEFLVPPHKDSIAEGGQCRQSWRVQKTLVQGLGFLFFYPLLPLAPLQEKSDNLHLTCSHSPPASRCRQTHPSASNAFGSHRSACPWLTRGTLGRDPERDTLISETESVNEGLGHLDHTSQGSQVAHSDLHSAGFLVHLCPSQSWPQLIEP